MKKLLTLLAIASLTSLSLTTTSQAQSPSADPKLEWATKVVALQQGPDLDRLVAQLADGAAQEVLRNWGPKLQANVPKAKIQQATDELNAELKKYFDDVSKSINNQVAKVSTDALVPAYMARFSIEELKQLVAFFESPAVKKYQSATSELGNVFVKQLVEASRADVTARIAQFDETAAKIVGVAPGGKSAPTGTAPASSPGEKSKSNPKK